MEKHIGSDSNLNGKSHSEMDELGVLLNGKSHSDMDELESKEKGIIIWDVINYYHFFKKRKV